MVKLTNFAGGIYSRPDVIRQLILNEVEGEEGPKMVLLNNSRYEDMPDMGMFGALTEKPVEGTTEKWQLINLTMDAHPMHMHLVQFQLVSRQKFDVMNYTMDWENSFTGVNGGMSGMYMGAEGPPFEYDKKNADGAVGGNLAVSHYLMGKPTPADPNERGWKDVIKAYPCEVMTYMVRFAPTELPIGIPKPLAKFSFDPSVGPGYAWHCHIVEHEDNDMMRPMNVQPNPSRKFTKYTPVSDDHNTLNGFVLEQNSPNPFNNMTEIRFSIPNDCHVQLKLMNSLGVEVRTLIDSDLPAGNQSVILSAADLPKGVYFYQLKAGLFTLSKTLIIN
jgi:hypothetical protein